MSPITAIIFGSGFSFAWTQWIGPVLISVLIMAGSAETRIKGFMLIGVYSAMDDGGYTFGAYRISSLPTTFMIDKEGNVFGYVQGGLTQEAMESIIEQTITGKRKQ